MLLSEALEEQSIEEVLANLGSGQALCVCDSCKKPFIFYESQMSLAKSCPTCKDKEQKRPSYVIERRCTARYDGIKIHSLPGEWTERREGFVGSHLASDGQELKFNKDDPRPYYGIDVKGGQYGASWSGRIVIYAPKPFQPGDVVSIREMEATHKVKRIRRVRPTLSHGQKVIGRNIHLDQEVDGDTYETQEARRYLVLEDSAEPHSGRELVWAEGHTKTTLKGFGRQYRHYVLGSPIARWDINGGVRSGREHTSGVLAIVSPENPLIIKITGDVQEERTYPA